MVDDPGRRLRLPAEAFINPDGTNRRAIRELFEQVVDLVLDLSTNAVSRPPLPPNAEDAVRSLPLGGSPATIDRLLQELELLIGASTNLSHPGTLAHMDPPPTAASILGDLVAAVLNNNLLFEELAPALTRLEDRLLRAIGDRFGLGDSAGGLMLPGGSLANLQAMVMARNAMEARHQGRGRRPVIVASDAVHSSIQKAAMVLGMKPSDLLLVRTEVDGRLDPDRLAVTLREAAAAECYPICVVATAGTTVTGSIDPLAEIGEIVRRQGLWLHVDAAYGGGLAYASRHRGLLDGVEQADSLTFDPQKWLYVARTASMLLLKRREDLQRFFHVALPYAGSSRQERGEIGLQGTSHADVLKLWLSLRHLGEEGYADLIDDSVDRAQRLAATLAEMPHVELACQPQTNVICFRTIPLGRWTGPADEWNLVLARHLLATADIFVSTPVWRRERWLRLLTLNPFAGDEVAGRLLAGIDDFYENPSRG